MRFIFATKEAWDSPEGQWIEQTAHREKTKMFEAPSKIIAYMSDTVTPQGMVAVAKKTEMAWPAEDARLLLGLCQIQDAGNLGTILRSAEAFGARGVFLTEGTCDPFNPKVVRDPCSGFRSCRACLGKIMVGGLVRRKLLWPGWRGRGRSLFWKSTGPNPSYFGLGRRGADCL
jgi:hypothetical protein